MRRNRRHAGRRRAPRQRGCFADEQAGWEGYGSMTTTRFVTGSELEVEELPWGPHEWLCRPGLTEAEGLLLVRVRMPPGKAHQFHRHPALEEIIYVVSGSAEQWVDRESRLLRAGDVAHIPRDVVHGTYNVGSDTLVFLAILSPARFAGPALVDVAHEEPWRSLKQPVVYREARS
jgi:quercetin dioxygenase-like cupin family protein